MVVGYIWRAFKVMGIIGDWAEKALADGKLSRAEKIEMANMICDALEIMEREEEGE